MYCINKNLPKYKELASKTSLSDLLLTTKISAWFDKNGTDRFPSLEDLSITENSLNRSMQDIEQNPTFYQNNTSQSTEEYIASEKTIRDLAARMSDRIGIPVRFESDRTKNYKGKLEKDTAVVNLAYATLDTPIHEILGHPIIRAIKNENAQSFEKWVRNNTKLHKKFPLMSGKKIVDERISKAEKDKLLAQFEKDNTGNIQLYQNLLKELETGKGKEVLDRIKRDYVNKKGKLKYRDAGNKLDVIETSTGRRLTFISEKSKKKALQERFIGENYTLEEQQEEAIVELLGLMTAEKLDNVKDGKLISLLKRLLKEMKAFMRSLLSQREIEIDKLPDNMTLGDLSDLLAYSNSKLILPGNEVVYTTPDNQTFKTYQEASNHISDLAKSVKDVDLSDIKVNLLKKAKTIEDVPSNFTIQKLDLTFKNIDGVWYYIYKSLSDKERKLKIKNSQDVIDAYNQYVEKQVDTIKQFIEKNKEYEQSKEIIEEWKKVNNIQYNPEEIYSRGQEFSSVVGAYSDFDVNLMMQNLLFHIEDNKKAGGKFVISAYTKPIDRQIKHLEGGGGKIKFKIYPQSNNILWAANTDVYSGSVWDASEKVNKDKKSELLGVSYTKYPSLRIVNAVQPNLANIVDNLEHYHDELGITLTGNNFRLEYDENIPYQTKKIIDSINSILDQKYGKLVKPEIRNNPIQPTQTNETLKESIENVQKRLDTNKEYTSQALINTKIAVLKEFAKKYPRSLIRSEVRPYLFDIDDSPFQLVGDKKLTPKQDTEGVSKLFESNPELANIGTQEQYSTYLDSIFPDSKVKHIVYRGRTSTGPVKIGRGIFGRGSYFSEDRSLAASFGNILTANILNLKNPITDIYYHPDFEDKEGYRNLHDIKKDEEGYIRENNNDGIIGLRQDFSKEIKEYVIFEPEQVHILGSKQDIQGFKDFVSKSFQRDSLMPDFTNMGEFDDMIHKMRIAFPGVDVVIDNDMVEYGRVENVNNKPTIFLRSSAKRDSVIHEFSHIFLQLYANTPKRKKEVQMALKKLRGKKVEKFVKAKYPHLTGAKLDEEILATAMGIEGVRLFDLEHNSTWWDRFKERVLQFIRDMLGLDEDYLTKLTKATMRDVHDVNGLQVETMYQMSDEEMERILDVADKENLAVGVGVDKDGKMLNKSSKFSTSKKSDNSKDTKQDTKESTQPTLVDDIIKERRKENESSQQPKQDQQKSQKQTNKSQKQTNKSQYSPNERDKVNYVDQISTDQLFPVYDELEAQVSYSDNITIDDFEINDSTLDKHTLDNYLSAIHNRTQLIKSNIAILENKGDADKKKKEKLVDLKRTLQKDFNRIIAAAKQEDKVAYEIINQTIESYQLFFDETKDENKYSISVFKEVEKTPKKDIMNLKADKIPEIGNEEEINKAKDHNEKIDKKIEAIRNDRSNYKRHDLSTLYMAINLLATYDQNILSLEFTTDQVLGGIPTKDIHGKEIPLKEREKIAKYKLRKFAEIKSSYPTLKQQVKQQSTELLIDKMFPHIHEVETRYRQKFEDEFYRRDEVKNLKGQKKKDAAFIYVNQRVAEKETKEKIHKEQREELEKELKVGGRNIDIVDAWATGYDNMNDLVIKAIKKMHDDANLNIRHEFNEKRRAYVEAAQEYLKNKSGSSLSKYDGMLEMDENGKPTNYLIDELPWFVRLAVKKYDIANFEYETSTKDEEARERWKEAMNEELTYFNQTFKVKEIKRNIERKGKTITVINKELFNGTNKPADLWLNEMDKDGNIESKMVATKKNYPGNKVHLKNLDKHKEKMKDKSYENFYKATVKYIKDIDELTLGGNKLRKSYTTMLPVINSDFFQSLGNNTMKEYSLDEVQRLYKRSADEEEMRAVVTNITEVPKFNRSHIRNQSLEVADIILADYYDAIVHNQKSKLRDATLTAEYLVSVRKVINRKGGEPKLDSRGYTTYLDPEKGDSISNINIIKDLREEQINRKTVSDNDTRLSQIARSTTSYTSRLLMLANPFAATATGLTGTLTRFIEASGGRHFSARDVTKAIGQVSKQFKDPSEMQKILKDISGVNKEPKARLHALQMFFNVKDDDTGIMTSITKGFASRNANLNVLYFNNITEIWNKYITMSSVLNATKLYDSKDQPIKKNGKNLNLNDIIEVNDGVVQIKKDAPKDIKTKYGILVQNGNLKMDTINIITRTMNGLNKRMDGAYANRNKSRLSRGAFGSMLESMKGWFVELFKTRYHGIIAGATMNKRKDETEKEYLKRYLDNVNYNEDLREYDEGYIQTAFRIGTSIIRSYKEDGFKEGLLSGIRNNLKSRSQWEKANLRKARTEIAVLLGLLMAGYLFDSDDEDDETTMALAFQFARYRLLSEISAFYWPPETMDILQSPLATLAVFERLGDFTSQLADPGELYEKGPYKGDTKIYHDTMNLLPASIIWRFKNMRELIENQVTVLKDL